MNGEEDRSSSASQYAMIERGMLDRLRRFAARLHTEQRMNGDEMRDMAHGLIGIAESAIDVPGELLAR